MAPTKTLKDYGHVTQVVSTFSWTIPDFFTIISRARKVHLLSPIFSTDNDCKHRWALQLVINISENRPVFKVHLVSNNDFNVKLNSFSFHLYYNDDVLLVKHMQKTEFISFGVFNGFRILRKYTKTLQKSTLDSKFTIDCTLSYPKSTMSANFYETPFKILDVYESLFLNVNHSDVTLVVNGREFPVHKAILTARSSVFAAMFEHDMKERHDNKANIEGIDPEVFQELLRFIYVGKVEKFEVIYKELLVAADMYDIEALKTACSNYILERINLENAIDYLIFADKYYAAEKLKALIMDFIVKNARDIVKTKEFKKLKALETPVVMELFERLAYSYS